MIDLYLEVLKGRLMATKKLLQQKLVRCLRIEIPLFNKRKFRINDCPVFWMAIFMRFYGEIPESTEDKRWEILLHDLKGLRLLSQLIGAKRYW
jgi:hypothetical protein